MVSTRPLISKFSSPCTNPLVIVPRVSITTDVTVTFMFHSIFQFPSKVLVLFFLFTFIQFYSVVSRDNKIHKSASSFFFPRFGDPFVSQDPCGVCVSHSPGQILGCTKTICSNGQTEIYSTTPHGSPCPLSCV